MHFIISPCKTENRMTKTFPCILCTLCYCRNVCAQKCFVLVFAFTSVSYSFIVTLNSFDLYNYYYCWRRRKENNCNTIKYMDDAYDMQSKLCLIVILCNGQRFSNQLRIKILMITIKHSPYWFSRPALCNFCSTEMIWNLLVYINIFEAC